MSTYTKFEFKAPKLVKIFKEIGIDISTSNGIFTEASEIYLPSGNSACVFDEDAWGKTLFGPEEMNLPRYLCGFNPQDSISAWLINNLADIRDKASYDEFCDEDYEDDEDYEEDEEYEDDEDYEEDEEYEDDEDYEEEFEDPCADFCCEIKALIEKQYPDEPAKKNIVKLDDFIEEASILFFDYWGGTDFEYTYAEIKNGELYYYSGSGEEEYEVYSDWYWRNLDEFISLIKEKISAEIFKRENGKWSEV